MAAENVFTLIDSELAVASASHVQYGTNVTYYHPSDLVRSKGLRAFTDMRRDDQVKAAMGFKKLAILSSGWKIQPPEGADENDPATRFVEHTLRNMDGALIEDLREMLTAMDYGFSVSEKIFHRIEQGEFSGRIGLSRIKTKSPDTFEFGVDHFGNLTAIYQVAVGTKRVPLPLDKFVLYSFDSEFGNPYGRSELEAAYRAWWSKDNAYKWMLMFLERHGIPPLMLMHPAGLPQSQQNTLKNILKNLQAGTVSLLPRASPDDYELKALELADSIERIFTPAINMYNADIARALLMPSLVGMTADNQAGSYARASVHFDALMMIVDRIRKCDIEERVMNEQVIPHLVDINYPGATEYPTFAFEPIQDSTRFELVKLWKEMVSVKAVTTGDDDELHIRTQLGFPLEIPEPDESRAVNKPASPFGGPPKPNDPDETQPVPEKPKEKESYAVKTKTAHEKKVDFAIVKGSLDGIAETAIVSVRDAMRSFLDAVVSKVRKGYDSDPFALIEAVDKISLKPAEDALKAMIRDAHADGIAHVTSETKGKKDFAVSKNMPGVTPRAAIKYLKAKELEVKGATSDAVRKVIKQSLLTAIKTGDGTEQTVQRLRRDLEPYTGGPDNEYDEDGDLTSPHRLETIARTVTTEAYNQGRLQEMRALGETIVPAVQYSAIIDERTSEVCEELHGRLFKLNDPDLDRFTPPNHFNSVPESTLITTKTGKTPICKIKVGDHVLTHTGTYKPVYSVMSKRSDHPTVKELHLSTGNTLRITNEHPILTTAGWSRAGDAKVGDVLFQNGDKMPGAVDVAVFSPNDYPSFFDEEPVPYLIHSFSLNPALIRVDLQANLESRPREVKNVFVDSMLKNHSVACANNGNKKRFGIRRVASPRRSAPNGRSIGSATSKVGVLIGHSLGMIKENIRSFFSKSIGPMFTSAKLEPSGSICDSRLINTSPYVNSMTFAPGRNNGFAESVLSFDLSNRFQLFKVLGLYERFKSLFVSHINHENTPKWVGAAIVSIVDVDNKEDLFNLAVADDETYVANDVIVHNCRSVLIEVVLDEDIDATKFLTDAEKGELKGLAGKGFV